MAQPQSIRLTLLLMKPVSILLCLLSIVGWCVSAPAQAGTLKSDALARSTQMIVVTTSDWNAVEGRLRRYERATVHEKWRPVGDPISIVVGKNGLGWGIGVIATDDAQVRVSSRPGQKGRRRQVARRRLRSGHRIRLCF